MCAPTISATSALLSPQNDVKVCQGASRRDYHASIWYVEESNDGQMFAIPTERLL
jgi:hypothetical protein